MKSLIHFTIAIIVNLGIAIALDFNKFNIGISLFLCGVYSILHALERIIKAINDKKYQIHE